MRIIQNKTLYSPTDLNNFVACKYTIKNAIKFHNKEIKKNDEKIDTKLWRKMGVKHEEKHFKLFKKDFKKTIIINKDLDEKSRFNKTKKAMQDGYDLIYHAYLIDGDFRGEADFLIKTKELKSKVFGDYSYEVYDTKISRNLRPRHVTQITAYSYMLSKVQKILPKKMYLIDGSDITHEYKTIEYINLFNHSKQEFDKFLSNIKTAT